MSTPHTVKQTALTLLVSLAAVAAVYFYSYGNSPQKDSAAYKSETLEPIVSDAAPLANNDDWRRDFLTVSSTPALRSGSGKTGSARSQYIGSPESNTVTAQFGREFFTQYINLKQSGLLEDKEVVDSVTNSLLSQDFLNSDQPRIYSTADIVVSPIEGVQAYKDYGNRVGFILKTYTPEKDDAYIAYSGIQKGDTSYVKELDSNISKYRTMINSLLRTPVPRSMSGAHLNLINGISTAHSVAVALGTSSSDPLRAMVAIGKIQTVSTLLFDGMRSIRNTLISAEINYEPTEGGSYFKINSNQ